MATYAMPTGSLVNLFSCLLTTLILMLIANLDHTLTQTIHNIHGYSKKMSADSCGLSSNSWCEGLHQLTAVHCSLSLVTHAPFYASVLRPASQVGPMHEAMGEVS